MCATDPTSLARGRRAHDVPPPAHNWCSEAAFRNYIRTLSGRSLLVRRTADQDGTAVLKRLNLTAGDRSEAGGHSFVPAYPRHLTIGNTVACNLRCRMCVRTLFEGTFPEEKDMDPATVDAIIQETFPYIDSVGLSVSGEPFAASNAATIIRAAQKHSVRVLVTTNGTLLHKGDTMRIVDEGVHSISISLDSPVRETYELIRRGARFDRTVRNVRDLVYLREKQCKTKPYIAVSMVLMKINIHQLPHMVHFAKDLGADSLAVVHMIPFDNDFRGQSLDTCPRIANEALLEATERAEKLGLTFVRPPLYDLGPKPEPPGGGPHKTPALPKEFKCPYLWRESFIEFDKAVRTCCVPIPTIGSLETSTFFHIWNNHAYRRFRASVYTPYAPESCRTCNLRVVRPEIAPDVNSEEI